MKEDVIAANLANLRQSLNELKETVNNLNEASQNHTQTAQSAVDEPLTNRLFAIALKKVSITVGTMSCRY